MVNSYIEITMDSAEFEELIERLRANMNANKFEHAMYGVFRDTSRHVSAILKKDLPKRYYVKSSEVSATVKNPILVMGGGNVGCTIPLTNRRKSIGGSYRATGSARGWQSIRKKYRVGASIVKGGKSILPANMPDEYGGQPPFRNIPSKLGKAAFTRESSDFRAKIRPVVGIAVPQMPMNRSEPEVRADIEKYLMKRLEQRVKALMINGT
jgi:hypothetical protein